jgi:beta-lactamase regulating signal transducer with metallopeptidase domain
VDNRTRWIIGLLLVLVIGLGVALIIVAADDSNDSGISDTASPATEKLTEPTSSTAPTTSTTPTTTTTPNGGTGVPGGTTTPGGGSGGL